MNPRFLIIGMHPSNFQAINTTIIQNFGKWFNIYDYTSAAEFFHAVQLWVLDEKIGPNYCIVQAEDISAGMRRIPKGNYEILMPTNELINAIIQAKPQ